MRRWAIIGTVTVAAIWAAAGARADDANTDDLSKMFALNDPTYLMIGAGGWEIDRSKFTAAEFDVALRPDAHFWIIKPQIGALASTTGDSLIYAGPLIDINLSDHFVISGSTSIAFFNSAGGYNLGSHLEFHSGIEVAWRMDDNSRLGIGYYHTSNADTAPRNPGSESALLEYELPIDIGL